MDIAFAIFSLIGFIFFFNKIEDDKTESNIIIKCVYLFGILMMLSFGFVIQNHGIDETEGEVECITR